MQCHLGSAQSVVGPAGGAPRGCVEGVATIDDGSSVDQAGRPLWVNRLEFWPFRDQHHGVGTAQSFFDIGGISELRVPGAGVFDGLRVGGYHFGTEAVQLHGDIEATLRGADAVVLVTEWPEFKSIDPAWAAGLVNTRTIIDGRNTLDSAAWRAAGWTYYGLGRP